MPQHVDVLVVGAGPVGLATAICTAQRGARVAVLERRRSLFDKCCGEGIMPAGVEALDEMGVKLAPDDKRAFIGVRYVEKEVEAEGHFAQGPGWAVRRPRLLVALRQRAAELGVIVHDGCTVQALAQSDEHARVEGTCGNAWRASTVVAADGLHSAWRNKLGLEAPPGRAPPRFGVRQHVACRPWSACIEVHLADGCEAYVTPIDAQTVGVAFLGGPKPAPFAAWLAKVARLRQRLHGLPMVTAPRGAGVLRQAVYRRHAGRVALVGDAAGYVDALSGDGMTLGFRCARALADLLAAGRPLAEYELAYRRLSASYCRETTALLALFARPRLRRGALWLAARSPRTFGALLSAHAAQRPVQLRDFRAVLGPTG